MLRYLLVWALTAGTGAAPATQFEDYPAPQIASATSPPDLSSHPRARRFRTVLRRATQASPPNFAGHYSLVLVGCGSECAAPVLVDRRDGHVFFPRTVVNAVWAYSCNEQLAGIQFKPRSRLLVIHGTTEPTGMIPGTYYFLWNGREFTPAGFQRAHCTGSSQCPR